MNPNNDNGTPNRIDKDVQASQPINNALALMVIVVAVTLITLISASMCGNIFSCR